MEDEVNPYKPYVCGEVPRSRWTLLLDQFRTERQRAARRFRQGFAVLHEGISFFVNPDDKALLYAASPSADESDSRMNLIISEVVRILPVFYSENEHLQTILRKRKVVVRMIRTYHDNQAQFIREVPVDLDLLG